MGNNKKLPKDPNAPKMPMKPFMYFTMEVNKDVRKELTKDPSFMENEINVQQQVAKACGKRWHALSESEKNKYYKLYEENHKRYQEEMKSYTPSPEFVEKLNRAKLQNHGSASNTSNTEITKVPHMVRAYFDYLTTTWPKVAVSNPRLNPQQIQEEVWRQWSGGESERRKTRWDENRNLQKTPRKRIRNKSASSNGSTPTQTKQAFQCFLEQMKGELKKHLPDLPYSEVVKHVSTKWRQMSQVEKEPFFVLEREEKEKSESHIKKIKKEAEVEDLSVKVDFVGSSRADQNEKSKEVDKDVAVNAQKTEGKSFLKEGAEPDEASSTSLVDDDFQIHFEEDGSDVTVAVQKDEETSKIKVENTHGGYFLPPSSSSCSNDSSDDDSDTTSNDTESDSD